MRGNVPQRARAEFDQGEAPGSTQMDHMRLVLSRSSEQQAALDAYLAELQDKSSPNYHKWLTPVEFGKLYGPADSDVAALVAWLESHGLKLETVSLGRTNIAFSGTVSQVEEAFHTKIHSFAVNGNQFYSNTTDPQIPAALAPVVKGVAHLNTIRPRPHSHPASTGKFNPETKRLEMVNPARPDLTLGSGTTSSPYFLYLVSGDAATIYDTPNSNNVNFSSGTSYTGTGVKIGVGGDATITASVVTQYRNLFLGSAFATAPILNYCTSSSSCSSTPGSGYNSSDKDEAYIDTELSGGIAPGAAIYYYASADLYTGLQAAIDANVIDIFSLSFGDCEADMGTNGTGGNGWFNSLWQQAAGQGIAVTVSSGDSGSAGCDAVSTSSGANVPDAVLGLAVSGFASTPYNIAVGGTDFYALNNSFTTYVNTTNAANYRSAKGYIPEATWNDSSYTDTTISVNEPLSAAGFPASDNNIAAGSGGKSSAYGKPTWQTGTGVPPDSKRDLPDISLMSGDGSYYAAWLVCSSVIPKGGTTAPNCAVSGGSFSFVGYGGTSTAAPTFAGILALVEQASGGRLGQAAQTLYELYNGSHASAIFHDTTVGNNSVPCTSAPDGSCVKDTAGYFFENGYNTTSGYDLATGLGSVDATQLVKYWSSSSGTAAATVTAIPAPNPVTTAEILSVPVTVTGSSGTPTGTVTLSGGGYTSTAETLVGGDYSFSIPAGSLAIGNDTLTVTYSGDTIYAATNKTATVQVNGLTASVTANASAGSITSNQPVTVTGVVSGSGGTPTGRVTLTGGGYTSPATAISGGSYSITIPASSLSTGSDMLTVTYSGNTVYDAGAFGTTTVTVTGVAPPPIFALSATTPASISPGGSSMSTVTVNSTTSYAGTVTLSCSLTSGPANQAGDAPTCSITSGATVTMTAGAPSPTSSTATVNTTPVTPASGELRSPKLHGGGWAGAGGGAILALLAFLGIPSRRRSWRQMLGAMVLMAAIGSLAGCGSSSGSTITNPGNPGTTAGSYVFTVTGTGSPAVSPAPTTTFTVTVN